MKCICIDCGAVFDFKPNLEKCPNCGSFNFTDAVECEGCGKYVDFDDTKCGLCPECFGSIESDIDVWFKVGKEETYAMQINGLIGALFDEDEISEICFDKLKQRQHDRRLFGLKEISYKQLYDEVEDLPDEVLDIVKERAQKRRDKENKAILEKMEREVDEE